MREWSSLPLRLGLGFMFAAHGFQKVFGLFGGSGVEGLSSMLSNLGFPLPLVMAYLAAYVELIGGICLLIGFWTRIAASLLFVLIVVAGVAVHLENGFFLMNGGVEYTFVIACSCLALILFGPGHLSVSQKF